MIPLALEVLEARVVRPAWCRKIAGCHDAESRGCAMTGVGRHRPGACLAVEDRLFHPGVELDIAPEVEAVGHMVDVAQDLGLRTVALGPMPFLLEFIGEGIRVFHAFNIAATPRVAVPIPGAADPGGGLKSTHLEAELAQTIDRVETANSRADDDRIEPRGAGVWGRHWDL